MRISRLALAGALAAGTLPGAGCAGDEPAPSADAPVEPVDTSTNAISGPVTAAAPDSAARPDRIYYDLTRFDWYARAQPLVFDDMFYEPDGTLVQLDARTVERVGEYGGVDVYRRDADANLYVPVYHGYWLGFAPAGRAVDPGDG